MAAEVKSFPMLSPFFSPSIEIFEFLEYTLLKYYCYITSPISHMLTGIIYFCGVSLLFVITRAAFALHGTLEASLTVITSYEALPIHFICTAILGS